MGFEVIASMCLGSIYIYIWILLFTGTKEDDLRVLLLCTLNVHCVQVCSIQEPCCILILDI